MLTGSSTLTIFDKDMLSEKQKSKENRDSMNFSSQTLGKIRTFPPSDFKDAHVEHKPCNSCTESSRGSICGDGLLADFSRHAPAFAVPAVALRVVDNVSSLITSCVNANNSSTKCSTRATARDTQPRKVRWSDGESSGDLVEYAGAPNKAMLENLIHQLESSDEVRKWKTELKFRASADEGSKRRLSTNDEQELLDDLYSGLVPFEVKSADNGGNAELDDLGTEAVAEVIRMTALVCARQLRLE